MIIEDAGSNGPYRGIKKFFLNPANINRSTADIFLWKQISYNHRGMDIVLGLTRPDDRTTSWSIVDMNNDAASKIGEKLVELSGKSRPVYNHRRITL